MVFSKFSIIFLKGSLEIMSSLIFQKQLQNFKILTPIFFRKFPAKFCGSWFSLYPNMRSQFSASFLIKNFWCTYLIKNFLEVKKMVIFWGKTQIRCRKLYFATSRLSKKSNVRHNLYEMVKKWCTYHNFFEFILDCSRVTILNYGFIGKLFSVRLNTKRIPRCL